MVSTIVGALLVLGGLAWSILTFGAASMASRQVTWWEDVGTPLLGLIPIVLGILCIVYR